MALEIVDAITFHISRVLEALFDGLEYGLATRALRRAARLKARRRSQQRVLPNEQVTTSSETAPVKTT